MATTSSLATVWLMMMRVTSVVELVCGAWGVVVVSCPGSALASASPPPEDVDAVSTSAAASSPPASDSEAEDVLVHSRLSR